MITELVTFKLPAGMTREQVVEAFRKRIAELYGSEPTSIYYETPIVVDNPARSVTDDAAAA